MPVPEKLILLIEDSKDDVFFFQPALPDAANPLPLVKGRHPYINNIYIQDSLFGRNPPFKHIFGELVKPFPPR